MNEEKTVLTKEQAEELKAVLESIKFLTNTKNIGAIRQKFTNLLYEIDGSLWKELEDIDVELWQAIEKLYAVRFTVIGLLDEVDDYVER